MDSNIAIKIAKDALSKASIENVEFWKATRQRRDDRNVWMVIFRFNEVEDRIICPDTLFIEVDEESGVAKMINNP